MRSVIDEHLRDQEGELSLHVLLGDVARWCVAAFDGADTDGVQRCLVYLDIALVRRGSSSPPPAVV